MKRIGIVMIAVVVSLAWLPVAAQDATPTAQAGSYLPLASALGDGWVQIATWSPETDPEIFVNSAAASYGGPDGAQLIISSWISKTDRAALQRSWETVSDLVITYQSWAFAVMTFYPDVQRPDPLPDGCIDAQQFEATNPQSSIPAGILQCAVDPDAILLIALSGPINGLTGAEATDQVAHIAIAAAGRT